MGYDWLGRMAYKGSVDNGAFKAQGVQLTAKLGYRSLTIWISIPVWVVWSGVQMLTATTVLPAFPAANTTLAYPGICWWFRVGCYS